MSDVTCRGSFALGTACRRCSKCKAEIEEYEVRKTVRESLDGTSVLKMQVTGWQNVAQVNGAVADQAKAEVARLTAELQKQSTLMDIGFAEYERRLATARRDAWKEAANFYDNSADFMRDRAAAIRALIAQEDAAKEGPTT